MIFRTNTQAPEFPDCLDWLNTTHPLTLEALRGKIILLHFWTYSSINCQHNIAQLQRIQKKFTEEVVIIGVHSARFPNERLTSNIRHAVMRLGINHPVINDAGYQVWRLFNIKAWPAIVLINPEGRIVSEINGEILADPFLHTIQDIINDNQEVIRNKPLILCSERLREEEGCFFYPGKIFYRKGGWLYIADTGHQRILELKLSDDFLSGEIIRTFGSGVSGFQDGEPSLASFSYPQGMTLINKNGNSLLYVADTGNHSIRSIDLSKGEVKTVAGTGKMAYGFIKRTEPTEMPLRSPRELYSLNEDLLITMAGAHQIWILTSKDELVPFAGDGREDLVDGDLKHCSFNQPNSIVYGSKHLYIADSDASAIRTITTEKNPKLSTIIGQGHFIFGDKDGDLSQAKLQFPSSLCYHRGKLYITDTYNHKIKMIDSNNKKVITLIGNGKPGLADGLFSQAQLYEPSGLAACEEFLFIADTNNHAIRVADLDHGIVYTLMITNHHDYMPFFPTRTIKTTLMPAIELAEGNSQINLEIKPPRGYSLLEEAPSIAMINIQSEESQVNVDCSGVIELPLKLSADQSIEVSIKVFYSKIDDKNFVLMHQRKLVIPLRPVIDGMKISTFAYHMDSE